MEFVEELPISLRHRVNACIYRETYNKILFLKNKDINFKTWVCPQLKSQFYQ